MRLILLDRDGVINEDSDDYIKAPEEWHPIPGSLEAIAQLHHAGYRVLVLTNQSGLARGLFDPDTLARIHQRMYQALAAVGGAVSGVFFCPHGPGDDCRCRKPLPGLFEEVAQRLQVSLDGVPAVGDSLRDLRAAEAAGARPILVRTGKGRHTEAALPANHGYPVFEDLAAVVRWLLAEPA